MAGDGLARNAEPGYQAVTTRMSLASRTDVDSRTGAASR
jgi:hypothetical protein